MNKKLPLVVSALLLLAIPVFAGELDEIIRYGLENSVSGVSIRSAYQNEQLTRRAGYYALIPSLSIGADYDYDNPSSGSQAMQYSLSFSKSFGDVDQTVRSLMSAEIDALIARYQAEMGYRNYIDSIIQSYANLCILIKQMEINLADIEAKETLLDTMQIKLEYGREIKLNVLKLSNEIELAKLDIRLQETDYSNELRTLSGLCGMTNAHYEFKLDVPRETNDLPVNNYELQLRIALLQLTNLNIDLSGERRSQFLPTLSLSLSESYDIDAGESAFNAGVGLNYSILDIIDRRNTIRDYEVSIASQKESIEDLERQLAIAESSYTAERASSIDKVRLLEDELDIERELEKLYRYQYETDQIDYYEYRVRRNNLLTAEMNLLQARSELFLLITRRNYGILKG